MILVRQRAQLKQEKPLPFKQYIRFAIFKGIWMDVRSIPGQKNGVSCSNPWCPDKKFLRPAALPAPVLLLVHPVPFPLGFHCGSRHLFF
jgi:hypothetical protein